MAAAHGVCLMIVLLTVQCLASLAQPQDQSPVVETNSGPIRGIRRQDETGRLYEEYLGIPYAAPPTGDLRWRKPVPPEPWVNLRDATEYGAPCVQFGGEKSTEDCLFLNVIVPQGVNGLGNRHLPVMVWIHGGAFIMGSSATYSTRDLVLNGEVIVVSFNYRLGVLGWLTTGDDQALGNYGLWDAHAVLKWVQANIGNFGGDRGRVTIIGQSAGAAMVSHLAIAPPARGLFHRAIALSGGSTSYFGTAPSWLAQTITKVVGQSMLCPTKNTERLINCLRKKDATRLFTLSLGSPVALKKLPPLWFPIVDGDFVPQSPKTSWEEGAASDVDFLSGNTHHDGACFVFADPYGTGSRINLAANKGLLTSIAKFMLKAYPDPEKRFAAIVDKYPEFQSDDATSRTNSSVKLLTDWLFNSGAHLEADEHSKNAIGKGTYVYEYQWRHSFQEYTKDWVNGSHIDDLHSVFGEIYKKEYRLENFEDPNFSEDDKIVSRHIMNYYTNFAYTGNPNEGPHPVPVEWEPYRERGHSYLRQSPVPEMMQVDEDRKHFHEFWNKLFHEVDADAEVGEYTVPSDPPNSEILAMYAELQDMFDTGEGGIPEDSILHTLLAALAATLDYMKIDL